AQLLGPAVGAGRATGPDEGVRERSAVAAREPDLPVPGRRRVRALVRPRVSWEAALRRPHADLHRADPASRAVCRGGPPRCAGGRGVRRWEIRQLLVAGVPAVRLVDAPRGWAGWKRVPTIRVTRAAR